MYELGAVPSAVPAVVSSPVDKPGRLTGRPVSQMPDRLVEEIERTYEEVTAAQRPAVLADRRQYAAAGDRHRRAAAAYDLTRRYREAEQAVADAEELLADGTGDGLEPTCAVPQEELLATGAGSTG
jgi:hypothetical protein